MLQWLLCQAFCCSGQLWSPSTQRFCKDLFLKRMAVVIPLISINCVRLFATPWTKACQASLSLTVSWSLLKFMSTELMMLSNHLILCHPFLLLLSVFPSIVVFSSELAFHIRQPEYWSFSISPSNEYSGLISFIIDWFDLLVVQEWLQVKCS